MWSFLSECEDAVRQAVEITIAEATKTCEKTVMEVRKYSIKVFSIYWCSF